MRKLNLSRRIKLGELVRRPKGQKIIGCKWIYKKKEGIPGVEDARYKAQLAVKGYIQREDIDFNEVFSPLVEHTSIHVLHALVAFCDLELEHELEVEIYMQQPNGFIPLGKDSVCLLEKSLFGSSLQGNDINSLIPLWMDMIIP